MKERFCRFSLFIRPQEDVFFNLAVSLPYLRGKCNVWISKEGIEARQEIKFQMDRPGEIQKEIHQTSIELRRKSNIMRYSTETALHIIRAAKKEMEIWSSRNGFWINRKDLAQLFASKGSNVYGVLHAFSWVTGLNSNREWQKYQ